MKMVSEACPFVRCVASRTEIGWRDQRHPALEMPSGIQHLFGWENRTIILPWSWLYEHCKVYWYQNVAKNKQQNWIQLFENHFLYITEIPSLQVALNFIRIILIIIFRKHWTKSMGIDFFYEFNNFFFKNLCTNIKKAYYKKTQSF